MFGYNNIFSQPFTFESDGDKNITLFSLPDSSVHIWSRQIVCGTSVFFMLSLDERNFLGHLKKNTLVPSKIIEKTKENMLLVDEQNLIRKSASNKRHPWRS